MVVPCFNEQTQIASVLDGIAEFVDCVLVVDDGSTDGTASLVEDYIKGEGENPRTTLLRRGKNGGPGAAVAAGYGEAVCRGIDVAVVVDGDGQMASEELIGIALPVVRGEADYAKGNRLFHREAWRVIPHHRYLGNAFLSMLTKIASGYWHVADSQSAFVAISREALETIGLEELYPSYGYPNDMLIRLNVYNFRVADVPIRPVYRVGEQSNLKIHSAVPRISWLIVRRFFWRMWHKYVIHDFHPLVLFYGASGLAGCLGAFLFVRLFWLWVASGRIPPVNALAWAFCMISSIQFGLFAMWFDMETNRDLKVSLKGRPTSRSNSCSDEDIDKKRS